MRKTNPADIPASRSLRFFYNTAAGRVILRPLVSRPVSAIAGKFLDTGASRVFIKRFIKSGGIDMSDYEQRKFSSFNDFFTRRVKDGARPCDGDPMSLVSPCDGRVSAYTVTNESSFMIKGVRYTLEELLQDGSLAEKYRGGNILIFRLAVDNYHRYIWCANGNAEAPVKIKGKYHTVQPIAMRRYKIFRENAREYTVLHSDNFSDIVQMEVGAMMVGRICNENICGAVNKGDEKGRFEFGGSTIIVLIGKNAADIDNELFLNTAKGLETHVKCGEKIGLKRQQNRLNKQS